MADLMERCAGALAVLQADAPNGTATGEAPRPEVNGACLTPEILQWAREQFSEEELAAGLRDLRENGGLELRDFLPELEQLVEPQ